VSYFNLDIPEITCGDGPNDQFFWKNPQYILQAIPPNKMVANTPIRLSYEGPLGSRVNIYLTLPGHNNRILYLDEKLPILSLPEVNSFVNNNKIVQYISSKVLLH
jgi:hypothetical protein